MKKVEEIEKFNESFIFEGFSSPIYGVERIK